MEEKNIPVVLDALADTIRELRFQLGLKEYDVKRLEDDNERLREAIKIMEDKKNA